MRGGGAGAATIMEFWTMEGYALEFLIGVAGVVVRRIFGGEEGSGLILSGGSFEDYIDVNLEGVRPIEGDLMVVS